MDSFFDLFAIFPSLEPESEPESSTPVDADGGGNGGCVVA